MTNMTYEGRNVRTQLDLTDRGYHTIPVATREMKLMHERYPQVIGMNT